MKSLRNIIKHARFSPLDVFFVTSITALLYTLMEWLFIISKPSFIIGSAVFEKLFILLNSTALLTIACLLVSTPIIVLYYLLPSKKLRAILRFVLCLVPALIMTSLILLLVDNITYTVFNFGVVSTKGVVRVLYLVGYIILFLLFTCTAFRFSHSFERSRRKSTARQKALFPISLGILLLLCAVLPALLNINPKTSQNQQAAEENTKNLPNIILITGDGINAVKLSLYGSDKDTTPFLIDLAKNSLVAENAFSNTQGTIGSTTSILTGKDPSDTRILADKDILKEEDAYEHLPGILKSYGYFTIQMSFSYYADAYKVNILNGFDEANGEMPVENSILTSLARLFPTDYYYFLREEYSRLSNRLAHIFFIKDMVNPFLMVTESPEKFNDQQKLDYLFSSLDKIKRPLFVHIHWMGTHGPKYYPEEQVFSAGKDIETQAKYDDSFYLDSILEFDRAIAQIHAALEQRNLVDQTILVVGSDHTQRWSISRIPLLFHFPHSEFSGKIQENVQNLDIAPTLLDYLGIPQPEWMPGQSLLTPLDPRRLIFLAAIPDSKKDPDTGKVTYPPAVAPYYQFGKMTLIFCDHYYQINFLKQKMTYDTVKGYIGDCSYPAPDKKEALNLILEHMRQYGFQTDQLESIIP